jgi:hypothetical protein
MKYITLCIIHSSIWKSSSYPNPSSSCDSHIQSSVPPKITTNRSIEKREGEERKIGRKREEQGRERGGEREGEREGERQKQRERGKERERKRVKKGEVVTYYHLSQRVITGDSPTHGKL